MAYDSTNRFEFEIAGNIRWRDSKHQKIEQRLEEIANAVLAVGQSAKRDRANREAEWRRREEAERLRRLDEARIEKLKSNVAKWLEAERIRAYLAAVRQKAESEDGGFKDDSRIAESSGGRVVTRTTLIRLVCRSKIGMMGKSRRAPAC